MLARYVGCLQAVSHVLRQESVHYRPTHSKHTSQLIASTELTHSPCSGCPEIPPAPRGPGGQLGIRPLRRSAGTCR